MESDLKKKPAPKTYTYSWMLAIIYLTVGFTAVLAELAFYGYSIFLLLPALIGVSAGLLPSRKYSLLGAWSGLIFFFILLLLGHFEALVCLVYTLPIALIAIVFGIFISYYRRQRKKEKVNRLNLILIPLLIFGFSALIEKIIGNSSVEGSVSTPLFLPYSAEEVFDEIKSVDTLDADKPFWMKFGLPVPQKCILTADTVGAKRTCYFEDGIIEEELTEIKRGEVLKMKVTNYSLPGLKWLRFKDAIYYFRPEKNGTVITRVTTYYSSLKPRFYWSWCEGAAIQSEHEYVLRNLKKDLENSHGKN